MHDNLCSRLAAHDACALSDALDRLGLEGCVTGLIAALPGRRISGRARTVRLAAGPSPAGAPVRHLGAAVIDIARPGDIVVIEQPPGHDAGCWGGLLSRAAVLRGIAGIVADGLVRDIDEIRELGLPVLCRGYTARTARGRVHEAATEEPVRICGITVEPGSYIVGDSSGVVFIRPADAERVLAAAAEIAAREGAMITRLEAGESASSVLGASYEHMLNKDAEDGRR
jgi:4-hydroxy-4-methyl-2-oxoglutarate aldolase